MFSQIARREVLLFSHRTYPQEHPTTNYDYTNNAYNKRAVHTKLVQLVYALRNKFRYTI